MAEALGWPEAEARNSGWDGIAFLVATAFVLALGLGGTGLVLHRLGPPAEGWTLSSILRTSRRALAAENGMLTAAVIVLAPFGLGLAYSGWVSRRWRGTEVSVTRHGITLTTPWQRRWIPWHHVSDVPHDLMGFSVSTRSGEKIRVPRLGLDHPRYRRGSEWETAHVDALQRVAGAYLHLAHHGPADPLDAPPELEARGCTFWWFPLYVFGAELVALLFCAFIFEPPQDVFDYALVGLIPPFLVGLCVAMRHEIRRQARVYLRADHTGLSVRQGDRIRVIPWDQVASLELGYRRMRATARVGDERIEFPLGRPHAVTVSLLARAAGCSTDELLVAAYRYYVPGGSQAG